MGYRTKNSALPAARPAGLRSAAAKAIPVMAERPHQKDVMNRLRRVEGQIRGVLAMMEKEESCDIIAQQLSAARKALDRAFYQMMACSLEMETRDTTNPTEISERIAEKTRLLAKYA